MAGIGSSIGSGIGMAAGTVLGGPVGAGLGAAAGGLVGGMIEAIPALVKTDAEKENERRLKQLQRMQEMGTLGLTTAEQNALFNRQQAQVQSQLQAAQGNIRAAGAAGAATGAGAAQLQQLGLAEAQAAQLAQVSRSVEEANLERKRQLEQEIQARIAAKSQAQQEALQAVTGAAGGAVMGGLEAYKLERTIQGKAPTAAEAQAFANLYGVSTDDATGLLSFANRSPVGSAILEGLMKGKM